MSKLQLLYEKLMKVSYIVSAIFFVLLLIDFLVGTVTGAIDCDAANRNFICIRDDRLFFVFSIIPFAVFTIVFLVAGRIFFEVANHESKLLSVSDYRKSLEKQTVDDDHISREELYEKLRRGKRMRDPNQISVWQKAVEALGDFWAKVGEKATSVKESTLDFINNQKTKMAMRKEQKAEMAKLEQQQVEQEALEEHKYRSKDKLTKTELVTILAKQTGLSPNDSRSFLNAFLETIREAVVADDDVKIAKFGRFSKVFIEEHEEYDPEVDKMVHVDAHNTVEFQPFKQLLVAFGIDTDEFEDQDEGEEPVVAVQAPVIEEEQTPEIVEEPIVEEVVEEEHAPEIVEEPIVEEVVEEEQTPEIVEETIVEEVVEEEQAPEIVEEPIVEEEQTPEIVEEEPIIDETETEESDEDDADDEKPSKKSGMPKVKEVVITKTKTDFIELLDATTDISKNKANKFLKYFADVVKEALSNNEEVELPGLGFFTTIEMPAKDAVNPQTNEAIIVPAHNQVRFRFDEDFKNRVNNE